MTSPDDPRPADGSVDAMRASLARAREERDSALRQVVELEEARDLAQSVALRFERELDEHRREVARTLNDEFGRHAVAIRSLAATFESRLAEREPSLAHLASLMVRTTDALLAAIRAAVQSARPEALEHGGLAEGLRALVADWRLRQPSVRFELMLDPPEGFGLAPAQVETAAHRIVQESVENAVLHGRAGTVVVSARRDGRAISLQVSDDGRGLPRRRPLPEGPGLRRMRELADAVGGSVTVGAGESGGTEVLARIPWPEAAGA